jgi:hypothetical protein
MRRQRLDATSQSGQAQEGKGNYPCCRLTREGLMEKVHDSRGLASRAIAFGALVVVATAIGTLAIGWITIPKLRFF